MMYVEIEQHSNDDGTEIEAGDEKMSLLLRKFSVCLFYPRDSPRKRFLEPPFSG